MNIVPSHLPKYVIKICLKVFSGFFSNVSIIITHPKMIEIQPSVPAVLASGLGIINMPDASCIEWMKIINSNKVMFLNLRFYMRTAFFFLFCFVCPTLERVLTMEIGNLIKESFNSWKRNDAIHIPLGNLSKQLVFYKKLI